MAKKYHYYVLVFTSTGPIYVTSIDYSNKYVHWDKDEVPMEFSSGYAEDLALGLNANLNYAVVVKSTKKIEGHPYRYDVFDCTFVEKKEEEK